MSNPMAGLRLILRLIPRLWVQMIVLSGLGLTASILDMFAIGMVVLILQFAFGTVELVEGFGPLGVVANFAAHLASSDGTLIAILIVAIVVSQSVLTTSYSGLASRLRLQAYQTFRETIFANWLLAPACTDRRQSAGGMVNTIQIVTWEAADASFQYCSLAIAVVTAGVYIIVMAVTSLSLTAIALVISASAFLVLNTISQKLRAQGERSLRQKEELSAHLVASLHTLRTIKLFRFAGSVTRRSNLLSKALRRTFDKIVLLETAIKPISDIAGVAILGVVVGTAFYLQYPAAIIVGFMIVLYRTQPRILAVHQILAQLARLQPSVLLIAEHMRATPEQETGHTFKGLRNWLSLKSVSYSYDAHRAPAIRDVNLEIKKGAMTALLGRSGAGKSTIVNLIVRLLEPKHGQILCDGVPIQSFSRDSWLQHIAVSGQEIELINGSLRENLLMGATTISEAQLWRAIDVAGAREIVSSLPDGLHSAVGPGGLRLSGGEQQRLCLARSLSAGADILILDEATNAIDAAMELSIYDGIRDAYPDLTLVVVAHRPAVAELADYVAVIDGGQVVEYGQPQDLARRKNGTFSLLVNRSRGVPCEDDSRVHDLVRV